jgi:hypothetical protein
MPRLGVTRARKRETVSTRRRETRRRRKSERERKRTFLPTFCVAFLTKKGKRC